MNRRWIARWLLSVTLVLVAASARADEIRAMVSGGFTAPYKILVAEWEKATGHTVITVYGASMGATPTAIPNRLARGEPADIVILARTALDRLVKDGRVVAHSEVDLVRSRIGMAVRAGAKPPDISSEARFRQALLDAKSIAYSDSASGVYISTEMFKKLGIADAVAGKAKMSPGTPVGEVVARGDAEIGFQQISELLPVSGIALLGPIPASVQMITTFSAGLPVTSQRQATARQLIAYLSSKEAWPTIRSAGLDPAGAPDGASLQRAGQKRRDVGAARLGDERHQHRDRLAHQLGLEPELRERGRRTREATGGAGKLRQRAGCTDCARRWRGLQQRGHAGHRARDL